LGSTTIITLIFCLTCYLTIGSRCLYVTLIKKFCARVVHPSGPLLPTAGCTQKLTKREIFHDHIKYLDTKRDALIEQLGRQIQAAMADQQRDYDAAVAAWGKWSARLDILSGRSTHPLSNSLTVGK